jgi:Zn-dependent peptidase ImmA (M78 family)
VVEAAEWREHVVMTKRREWYHGVPAGNRFDDEERRELKLFEVLCRHFAYLERVVAGEVSFELATYQVSDLAESALPSDDEGRNLARRERQRLCLGKDPIVGMKELLDAMAIKVFSRLLPEGSDIEGAFLFRSDVGPCIMVNSSQSPERQTLALAHQYCHFLADFDPYLPRVCVGGTFSETDACEKRAWSFALEFLLPGDALLGLLGREEGDGVRTSELEALALYFGVAKSAVAEQLARLGLRAEQVEGELARETREVSSDRVARLPERFVRLAVEARSKGFISNLRAARLLQIPPRVAMELMAFFAPGKILDWE